jgi:hypothetical protein
MRKGQLDIQVYRLNMVAGVRVGVVSRALLGQITSIDHQFGTRYK